MVDYTSDDMVHALREAGLQEGDTALFHMSLGMLGIPEGVDTQEGLNRHFLECVREVLGPGGTMLIPVYTYSLCRGETFDVRSTPAGIGPFPEFFRRLPGVVRSCDPILSVCGCGPSASELLSCLPPTSYGAGSLYSRLVERGAKICTVGLGLNWATFLHHIEEIAEVPYRYRKVFSGNMIDESGIEREIDWLYNVRLWVNNANVDANELADMIVRDGVCRKVRIGRSGACCVPADRYFDYASDKMRDNPWIAAKGPAGDPRELEAARVPHLSFDPSLSVDSSLDDMIRVLSPLPRDGVCDASDAALNALASVLPMRFHLFRTGELHGASVIPEKWTCWEASVRNLAGETLLSLEDSPLHVMSRSHAFEGEVSRDQLLAHLHAHPTDPDAIPFVRTRTSRQWGLCCTARQKAQFVEQRYHVAVRSTFSMGEMRVAESVLPGQSPTGELVMCAHLGLPGQFNDGLSGVLTGMEVMRALQTAKLRKITCRLVIFPGQEGLHAWICQAGQRDNRLLVFMNMLATSAPLTLSGPLCNTPLAQAFTAGIPGIAWQDHADGSPPHHDGSGIVMPALRRVLAQGHPHFPYREHLSSADSPSAFEPGRLMSTTDALLAAIRTCEAAL